MVGYYATDVLKGFTLCGANYVHHIFVAAPLLRGLENFFVEFLALGIFGELDAMKVRSSMTLFDAVCPNDMFAEVLEKFYNGERCGITIAKLNEI